MWDSGYVNDPVDNQHKQPSTLTSRGDDEQGKNTMPVTIAYIDKFTRPDDGLVINEKKISSITIVAMISEIIDQTPTRLHIKIDDGTKGSPIEAIYIKTDGGQLPFELEIGKYVRIYGHAKYQDNKAFITPFNIGPLIDINEITMHALEVIKEMMSLDHATSAAPKAAAPQRLNANNANTVNDPLGMPNLPTLHKRVLNYLRDAVKDDPEKSVSEDKICADLRSISKADISKALQDLCYEGHLWNGDTDDQWCVAT